MITKLEKETIVEFGNGTVRIMAAGIIGDSAVLGFKTQEAKPIGSTTPYDIQGKPLSLPEPEVILAFKNVECLDVLIEELQLLRKEIFE